LEYRRTISFQFFPVTGHTSGQLTKVQEAATLNAFQPHVLWGRFLHGQHQMLGGLVPTLGHSENRSFNSGSRKLLSTCLDPLGHKPPLHLAARGQPANNLG
jgi:hypothetical protein